MHGHGGGAAAFVAGWMAMMVPMMLPALVPVLSRAARPVVLAAGYYAVWTAVGLAVHAGGGVVGAAVAAFPGTGGIVMLLAGALQFTAWKARGLARCREAAAGDAARSAAAAWRQGLWLGVHCVRSCAGSTAVLLALGAMDLLVSTLVASAITAERVLPRGLLAAHVAGAAAVVAGLAMFVGAWR